MDSTEIFEHADLAIRETVPLALDDLGCKEIAQAFRDLRKITSRYRVEKAADLLNSALRTVFELRTGAVILSEISKKELRTVELDHAQFALMAALRTSMRILSQANPATRLN